MTGIIQLAGQVLAFAVRQWPRPSTVVLSDRATRQQLHVDLWLPFAWREGARVQGLVSAMESLGRALPNPYRFVTGRRYFLPETELLVSYRSLVDQTEWEVLVTVGKGMVGAPERLRVDVLVDGGQV